MDLLQIATAITKCDGFITNCESYYKVRWIYYKLRQLSLLQSAMDCYYKLRHLFYYKVRHGLLQIATAITKCDDYYKLQQYIRSGS